MTSIPSLNVTPRTSFGNWLVTVETAPAFLGTLDQRQFGGGLRFGHPDLLQRALEPSAAGSSATWRAHWRSCAPNSAARALSAISRRRPSRTRARHRR